MIDSFKGRFAFCSNFSGHGFWYGDVWYPTNEHFYQAMKTLNQKHREMIAKAMTAKIAKAMGSARGYKLPNGELFKITLRKDWEQICVRVMLFGVRKKFNEHPDIAEKLIKTYPLYLMEGNWWHDNKWGNCTCGRLAKCAKRGANLLGEILIIVRQELMERRQQS